MALNHRRAAEEEVPAGRREGGAALILVLIFGIGSMTLVLLLLGLSNTGLKAEAEHHRMKAMQAVLRTGIAMSLYEVNYYRLKPDHSFDPGNDGVGAILGPNQDGLVVTDDGTATGKPIGKFRSTWRDDGGKAVLTVVAVDPGFDFSTYASGGRPEEMASAQVVVDLILPPWLRDRNALSIVGPQPASTAFPFKMEGGSHVTLTGTDVPAVNITDNTLYTNFYNMVSSPSGNNNLLLTGTDPSSGGSSTGASTIDNTSAGLITTQVVQQLADSIDTYAEQNAGSNVITQAQFLSGVGLNDDPNAIYYLSSDTQIPSSSTITGSGTLIVAGNLSVVGKLNWTGNIIIDNVGSSADTSHTSGTAAGIAVKGTVSVTGTLAVQGQQGDASLSGSSGGRTTVNGDLLVFSGSSTTNEIAFPGSRLDVNGLYLTMGDSINMDFQHGGGQIGNLNVTGSTILAIPDGATTGLKSFDLSHGGGANLTFNNDLFMTGVNQLRQFVNLNPGTLFPLGALGYWEGGADLIAQQATDIAGASGKPGYPGEL